MRDILHWLFVKLHIIHPVSMKAKEWVKLGDALQEGLDMAMKEYENVEKIKIEDLETEPFTWNVPMTEEAQEYFSVIQNQLSYNACTSIGMALAKLKLLEEQGKRVKE